MSEVDYILASDVIPVEITWLWKPYIPLGKLTLIEGNPGQGKTWIMLALVKELTTGMQMPLDMTTREPVSVIYCSSEDGIEDTLVPRLKYLGADLTKIAFLRGSRTKDNKHRQFSLNDLSPLIQLLKLHKAAIVVIDPIQAYMGGKVDINRANEVREILAVLCEMAQKMKFAAVCVRHLTKSGKDNVMFRGMGSIDFTATARSVLLVGNNPMDKGQKAIAQVKNNLAAFGPSIGYTVTEENGFRWTGESVLTADDLVRPTEESAIGAGWLSKELVNGPMPVKELFDRAGKLGISSWQLKQAKKDLGVRSKKDGQGNWQWDFNE